MPTYQIKCKHEDLGCLMLLIVIGICSLAGFWAAVIFWCLVTIVANTRVVRVDDARKGKEE